MKDAKVGSFSRSLEFLEISPLAKPLAAGGFYEQTGNGQTQNLFKLALDMVEAIAFAHEKKTSNNDISTNNILLVQTQENKFRAVLFDCSEATQLETEMMFGFIGTPNFAHRDAHKNELWHASDFHNFASLGFVLADLCRFDDQNGWKMAAWVLLLREMEPNTAL